MFAIDRLNPLLRRRMADRLAWSDLRPAQKFAISPILDGHNTLIIAPTAGGKTEAAFVPLLSRLQTETLGPLSVLYLSPLKALLNNQESRLTRLAAMVDREVFRWHGDVREGAKHAFLRSRADILLITPESLEGLFAGRHEFLFERLQAIVVDEIHAFAGTDRGSQLISLIERAAMAADHDLQRVGLSATIGNPTDLLEWLSGSSRRPKTVVDPPRAPVKRLFKLHRIPDESPDVVAQSSVPYLRGRKALFFVNSKRKAEGLKPALDRVDIDARIHHASLHRRVRESAESAVLTSPTACLLCTSTMELGVDVGDVEVVVQLGAPTTVAAYLQRMGRAGRRGKPGSMIVLTGEKCGFLRAIALNELALKRWCEPVHLSGRAWPVYLQQILALVLAEHTLSPAAIYDRLCPCPAFRQIRNAEFESLIAHLVANGYLERLGTGRIGFDAIQLRLGHKSEIELGARNYAALRSVFEESGPQVTVYSNGEAVGAVDRGFARKVAMGQEFTLAGRSWRASKMNWHSLRLDVAEGLAGGPTSWIGTPGTPMATEVAREIRLLVTGWAFPSYLDQPERKYLEEIRAEYGALGLKAGSFPLKPSSLREGGRSRRMTLWTLAGERVNRALGLLLADAYGATAFENWKSVTVVAAPGAKLDPAVLATLFDRWREHGFAFNEKARALKQLPAVGGSRFSKMLPTDLDLESRGADLLDFEGALAFLREHRISET